MSTPNLSVAEDCDSGRASAPKRLSQAGKSLGKALASMIFAVNGGGFPTAEPPRIAAIFSFAGSPIGTRSFSTVD